MSSIETVQNLHPDPRCLKMRGAWHGTWVMSGEKRRYSLADDGATVGSCFAWEPLTNAQMRGVVLYARITSETQAVIDNLDIEQARILVRRDGWVASRVPDDNTGNHTLPLAYGPFTLCEVGVYTPEDWAKLYDAYQKGKIAYPWVAGPRDATMAGETGPWEL